MALLPFRSAASDLGFPLSWIMDDIVSAARCDGEHLSHSEDVKQIEFQLRNLEVLSTCEIFRRNNKAR